MPQGEGAALIERRNELADAAHPKEPRRPCAFPAVQNGNLSRAQQRYEDTALATS